MNYVNTHSITYVWYHASDMILTFNSSAAYLLAPQVRSRVAGYFQLTSYPSKTTHPSINGAILVECKTLRHVVSLSAEAEMAGIYHNAQMAVPIRTI